MNSPLGYGGPPGGGNIGSGFSGSERVEAWFAVEPAGAIAHSLNFGKFNRYVWDYIFILPSSSQ